jgi:hypothetical protein
MKIIKLSKGETLHNNEPYWFSKKLYAIKSSFDYWNYPYIALGDNGEVYAIEGDSESKDWYAIRFSLKPSAVVEVEIYKAMINVVPTNTRSAFFAKRKDLVQALESGAVTWVPCQSGRQSSAPPASTAGEADMAINISIRPSKVFSDTRREQQKSTIGRPGLKRVGVACLLSLVGVFLPGMSLVAVPLLVSGSDALLGKVDHPGQPSLASASLFFLGIAFAFFGIFLPVFSFVSFILVCQSYVMRCPSIYKGSVDVSSR